MKNNILVYCDEPFAFYDLLSAEWNVRSVESKEELLQCLDKASFQLIIMSDKYIVHANAYGYKNIRSHSMFYDIPIIAYTKTDDFDSLVKLYSLNVQGCIEPEFSSERVLTIIVEILNRSNPYIGTLRDKFLKAFIRYEEASNSVHNVLYLTNYLICHYELDKEVAEDVRVAVILLTIALKKNKLDKIIRLLHDMSVSPYLERVLGGYKNPKSLDEHIILASLLYGDKVSCNFYTLDATVIDREIATLAYDALQKSKIFISSSHDIYSFWERLDDVLSTYPKLSFENYHFYLHYVFKILYKALVNYGSLQAEFNNSLDDVFRVIITPKGCTDETMEMCIADFGINNGGITFKKTILDSKIALLIELNVISQVSSSSPSISSPPIEKVVDTSKRNSMHYKDESKISAKIFLEDFSIDYYLLDDLSDNEKDAKGSLYLREELTDEMVEAVALTFTKYAQLLNETIEFEDLAYSVNALAHLLETVTVKSLDEETKKLFKLYIMGIIDDLGSWRKHIFVMQDTPDIHYLDASLLDNCSEIEALVNPRIKESDINDESDLEFF